MTEQEANKLPLEEHALQVCYAIEECGASTQLTTAAVLASALHGRIKEIRYALGWARCVDCNSDLLATSEGTGAAN